MFGNTIFGQNPDMENYLSASLSITNDNTPFADSAHSKCGSDITSYSIRWAFDTKDEDQPKRFSHRRHGRDAQLSLKPVIYANRTKAIVYESKCSELRNFELRGGLQLESKAANMMFWAEGGYNFFRQQNEWNQKSTDPNAAAKYFQKYEDIKQSLPELTVGFTIHNWYLPMRWRNQATFCQGMTPEFSSDLSIMFNREENLSPYFGARYTTGGFSQNYANSGAIFYGGLDFMGDFTIAAEYNPTFNFLAFKAVIHLDSNGGGSSNYCSGSGCEAYGWR